MIDEYFTIASFCRSEIKVRGSRFIGTASPAANISEASKFIDDVSKKYFNATHNCFAYSLRSEGQITERASDAGEPAGTAGQPILSIIAGRGISNIVVVVTRYFGGTKLGKGGLVRAYGDCTREVLDKCRIIKMIDYAEITIHFPYVMTGPVMHLVDQVNACVDRSVYEQQVELKVRVPRASLDEFKQKIISITSGKVVF